MSALKIFSETWGQSNGSQVTDLFFDDAEISRELQAIGVQYEVWKTSSTRDTMTSEADILHAYAEQIDRLNNHHGFTTVDVVSLDDGHADKVAIRQKFLNEHTHSDFEVRFFVAGQGLFYLHHGNRVYAVLCEQGTLISIPAGNKHWFDMGGTPSFTCIRFFCDPEGWVAEYTGDDIAKNFPLLDEFVVDIR